MPNYLFNQADATERLKTFFTREKPELDAFGRMVNQTFEAYTFAATVKWYKEQGWSVIINNPTVEGKKVFKLKFSTRGRPENYSYATCTKLEKICQIRHQLRVATKSHKEINKQRANICCDVVVLNNIDLECYSTKEAIPNEDLISFGEVKHMSAFAELVAGFIGMVHELQPSRLKRIRTKALPIRDHIAPYLNVSGNLWPTAKGLEETIKKRKYDIDIYCYENKIDI